MDQTTISSYVNSLSKENKDRLLNIMIYYLINIGDVKFDSNENGCFYWTTDGDNLLKTENMDLIMKSNTKVLEAIKLAWEINPDINLGRLIHNLSEPTSVFNIDDETLARNAKAHYEENKYEARIARAINIAIEKASYDSDNHKMWVIRT